MQDSKSTGPVRAYISAERIIVLECEVCALFARIQGSERTDLSDVRTYRPNPQVDPSAPPSATGRPTSTASDAEVCTHEHLANGGPHRL